MVRELGGIFGKCIFIEIWIRKNFKNIRVVNIFKCDGCYKR